MKREQKQWRERRREALVFLAAAMNPMEGREVPSATDAGRALGVQASRMALLYRRLLAEGLLHKTGATNNARWYLTVAGLNAAEAAAPPAPPTPTVHCYTPEPRVSWWSRLISWLRGSAVEA